MDTRRLERIVITRTPTPETLIHHFLIVLINDVLTPALSLLRRRQHAQNPFQCRPRNKLSFPGTRQEYW